MSGAGVRELTLGSRSIPGRLITLCELVVRYEMLVQAANRFSFGRQGKLQHAHGYGGSRS